MVIMSAMLQFPGDGKSYAYTISDDDDYISYVGTKAGKDNKVKDVEIFAILQ